MRTRKTDQAATTDKLTDKLVKALSAPAEGNSVTYDGEVPGFGCRVTKAGAKSFVLNFRGRPCRREHRYTIGGYPSWSVAAARDEAKALRRQNDRGECPMCSRKAELDAPLVNDLADYYEEEHLPGKAPKSQAEDRRLIKQFIRPKLGKMKVALVEFDDIAKLHRAMKGTGTQANRTLALLSKMFSLAIRRRWRPDNPCRGVKRNAESRRKRYLTAEELRRLTAALAAYPDQRATKAAEHRGDKVKPETIAAARRQAEQVANIIRLGLLTGARPGEARTARWDQLNLERGRWIKPGATTKQRTEHDAPLSEAAVILLRGILTAADKGEDGEPASPWVFPGTDQDKPLGQIKGAWEHLRKAAGVPDVRLNDLRHSFASLLASGGASLPMIGALLGHSNPSTTARYAHLFDDPLRKLADEVGHVVSGTESADVVPMQRQK